MRFSAAQIEVYTNTNDLGDFPPPSLGTEYVADNLAGYLRNHVPGDSYPLSCAVGVLRYAPGGYFVGFSGHFPTTATQERLRGCVAEFARAMATGDLDIDPDKWTGPDDASIRNSITLVPLQLKDYLTEQTLLKIQSGGGVSERDRRGLHCVEPKLFHHYHNTFQARADPSTLTMSVFWFSNEGTDLNFAYAVLDERGHWVEEEHSLQHMIPCRHCLAASDSLVQGFKVVTGGLHKMITGGKKKKAFSIPAAKKDSSYDAKTPAPTFSVKK